MPGEGVGLRLELDSVVLALEIKLVRLLEPRHPNGLGAEHPTIVEDLIAIAEAGDREALDAIVGMLADLSRQRCSRV
jgi:hypothetical protein